MEQNRKFSQYLVTVSVNFATLAIGMAMCWSSPAATKLKNKYETPLKRTITTEEESWIGSLIALGGIFGPVLAGIACNRVGRKITLLLSIVPLIVAWTLICTTKTIQQIYIARVFMGVSMGCVCTVIPMYVGEIAEDSIRGILGSIMQIFLTLGFLISYCIGPYVSFFWFGISCLIPSLIFIATFIWCPETPAFLIAVDRIDDAKLALRKLRNTNSNLLFKELFAMQETVERSMSNEALLMDIFRDRENRKPLLLMLVLMAGQQFSGINVVLFYTETIFKATGSAIPADISSIIIGSIQCFASLCTPLFIERLGRKPLLILSAFGMAIGLGGLGAAFFLHDSDINLKSFSFVPIVSLVIFVFLFGIGYGSISWVVMGEMFSPNIKSIASTVSTSFCWLTALIITKCFSNVSEAFGNSTTFWIFSGCCIFSGIFVLIFLPETKGKSLQEIQDIFI